MRQTHQTYKINQLELRKELLSYAKEAIREIQEISENEQNQIVYCFETSKQKEDLESKINKVEEAIEDTIKNPRDDKSNCIIKREINSSSKITIKR